MTPGQYARGGDQLAISWASSDTALGTLLLAATDQGICSVQLGDALPPVNNGHAAVIVYGGAESANDVDSLSHVREEIDWIGKWVETGRPYLGICLGSQLLARALGARVSRHAEGVHEIGYVKIEPTPAAASSATVDALARATTRSALA